MNSKFSKRILLVIPLLAACSGDGIVNVPASSGSSTISVGLRDEVRIRLANIGPAQYETPPQISSPVLSFLGVAVVPPFTPGGPTQEFRFLAVASGDAIVHFRRTLNDSVVNVVEDTVRVY